MELASFFDSFGFEYFLYITILPIYLVIMVLMGAYSLKHMYFAMITWLVFWYSSKDIEINQFQIIIVRFRERSIRRHINSDAMWSKDLIIFDEGEQKVEEKVLISSHRLLKSYRILDTVIL